MTRKFTRIEPTLTGDKTPLDDALLNVARQPTSNQQQKVNNAGFSRSQKTPSLAEKIISMLQVFFFSTLKIIKQFCQDKVFINRRINIIVSAIIITIFIISLLIAMLTDDEDVTVDAPQEELISQQDNVDLLQRNHQITLPDHYSLFATNYNGIIIHWQAQATAEKTLWDIQTIEGEQKCQDITFNNKDSFRTLNVKVENNKEYFAYFSPLDSVSLVKAIARNNDFMLCGFKFSLKDSQSTLGKHPFYSDLLSE